MPCLSNCKYDNGDYLVMLTWFIGGHDWGVSYSLLVPTTRQGIRGNQISSKSTYDICFYCWYLLYVDQEMTLYNHYSEYLTINNKYNNNVIHADVINIA